MRRKRLKTLVFSILLTLFIFIGNKVVDKILQKQKFEKSISTIPDFNFKTVNGTSFTKKNLKSGTSTVFLYFNSECDFCQHEAKSIADDHHLIKNVQLVFISTEPMEQIINFSKVYALDKKASVIFVQDEAKRFTKIFQPSSIPFNLIYDKEQKLLKTQKGQLTVQGLLKIIN
ncbi:MAG: redoxin domain-containing protein [Muricauda sp.]|nr:redoxin domain-containing protein [Allomuricauda sp.]MBA4746742.1 redoxin domain-containing protein [Allomuricauda sp.]